MDIGLCFGRCGLPGLRGPEVEARPGTERRRLDAASRPLDVGAFLSSFRSSVRMAKPKELRTWAVRLLELPRRCVAGLEGGGLLLDVLGPLLAEEVLLSGARVVLAREWLRNPAVARLGGAVLLLALLAVEEALERAWVI